jgi:hypothetical protein
MVNGVFTVFTVGLDPIFASKKGGCSAPGVDPTVPLLAGFSL